ncbi:bem46 protein, variant, variant 2 [Stygiomarasmius scandens]
MLPITPAVWKDGETDEDYMARRPTVIMFHGNGGNVGHRIPLGMMFQQFMRCNVLMVSYRGYGNSEGAPSERGFQMDAQAALDFVLHDPRFGKTPIILYGQSIGGAVSIDLASRNPDKIESLILENTFTSLPALVPHVLPLLSPFTFLCHQKWESEAKIFGYLPEGQGQNLTPNQSQVSTSRRASTEKQGGSSSASGSGSTPGTSTSTSDAPVVGGARSHKDKRYKGIPRGTRVLLLSGKLDQIVPPEHMLALKTAFKERTKTRKSLGLAPSPFLPRSSSATSSSSLGLRKTPSSTRARPREEGAGGMTFSTRGRTSTLSSESSFSSSISTGTGEEEKWEVLSDEKESEKMKGKEREVEEKEEDVQIYVQEGEDDDEPERSRWEEFPSGSHNDTSAQAGYWNIVEEFVSEIAREWALAKERQSQRGRL